MYEFIISIKARHELKKLSVSHQISILKIFQDIKEDPYLGKPLLRELFRRFSYRVVVYRIIYKINEKDKTITIFSAGHRSVIYN